MNAGVGTELADASGNGNVAVGRNFAWAQGVNSAAVVLKDGGWINGGNDASLSPSDAISIEAWIFVCPMVPRSGPWPEALSGLPGP